MMLRALLLALWVAGALVSGGAALAQTNSAPTAPATAAAIDYEAWDAAATRAERMVTVARASTAVFEALRDSLAGWRAQFLAAQDTNAARIGTLQAQIDALGPAPEGDQAEPDAIAARRLELTEQLSIAQVPRVNATEAFNRADGLIAEIDALLAARQTQALLELEPTPLLPSSWTGALTGLRDLGASLYTDTAERISRPDLQANAAEQIGRILILSFFGIVLLTAGRRGVAMVAEGAFANRPSTGRVSLRYIVSLAQAALPVVGIYLLTLAVRQTGFLTDDLSVLLTAALQALIALSFGLWLAGRMFPANPDRPAAFAAEPDLRTPARRAVTAIGLFLGLAVLAEAIANMEFMPVGARGVFLLPVYLGLAFWYNRLARALRLIRATGADGAAPAFGLRVAGFMTRALFVIGVVGPLLAAIGYLNAAQELMVPTALTLAVFGVLVSLQPVIRDLYAFVFRTTPEAAVEALTPVLVNLALSLAALPVLALIWGTRPERLLEIYAQALEGVRFGDIRVTPGTVLAILAVFALGLLATRLLQSALKTTVLPRTRLDSGAQNAVTAGVGYVGVALAALIAITAGGIDLTALGFVVGALSVGIGFGLQNVVSNFVSGIILLIERPISEGDWIEVNGNMGIVKDISVRSTRIETFDRTDVIVPNADFISGTITNWTRGDLIGRITITVGVAYGTDTRKVQDLLLEIAKGHPEVTIFPAPGVDFLGFGADALEFRIRAILRDVNQSLGVKTELNHQIAERFAAEGIEIPYAQRDIWLRNPEALRTPGPEAEA